MGLRMAVVLGSVALACGGQSVAGADDPPPQEKAAACAAPAISFSKVWSAPLGHYGMRAQGFLGFSPDGTRIGTVGSSSGGDGFWEYSVADGTLARTTEAFPLDLDRDWKRLLVERTEGVPTLLEVETARPLVVLRGQYGAISRNGAYLGAVQCNSFAHRDDVVSRQVVPLEPGDGADGDSITVRLPDRVCHRPYESPPVLATSSGRVLATTAEGELIDASFEPPALRVTQVSDQPIYGMQLSPSESRLLVATGDGKVAVLSYPALTPILTDLIAPLTAAFDDCYCVGRTYTPLAWSPDEALFITAVEGGGLGIYQTCDGALVGSMAAPVVPRHAMRGASYVAFDPTGQLVATFFEGELGLYRLEKSWPDSAR